MKNYARFGDLKVWADFLFCGEKYFKVGNGKAQKYGRVGEFSFGEGELVEKCPKTALGGLSIYKNGGNLVADLRGSELIGENYGYRNAGNGQV